MRTAYVFHENLNNKCLSCKHYLWYQKYKQYNCRLHWCSDNHLFHEFSLSEYVKEKSMQRSSDGGEIL